MPAVGSLTMTSPAASRAARARRYARALVDQPADAGDGSRAARGEHGRLPARLGQHYPVSLALLAAGGFAGLVATMTANTRLQLLVPDELRVRVMSTYVLLMQGTAPSARSASARSASAPVTR
jgi:hypothetical protein